MANHKSAIKRVRQSNKKRLHNKYYHKTTRNAIARLRSLTDAAEAKLALPKIFSMLDKLAKRGIIHANKAANLKSSASKFVSALA